MWFDCTKTALNKLNVVCNNNLHRIRNYKDNGLTALVKFGMVNLNINLFLEMLGIFTSGFMLRV